MNGLVGTADVERFRMIVGLRLGLQFDSGQTGFLADVLRQRLEGFGAGCASYLNRLAIGALSAEIGPLASALTNNESFFFRNIEQFDAFAAVVIPDRIRARAERRRHLQVLSVGCAAGEEAYTLAMVLRQHVRDPSWDVTIVGVDVDPEALRRARAARYSGWALRSTPDLMRNRWFRPDGNGVLLREEISRSVRFVERNLAADDPELWRADTYDAIFCRNVLMYLTPNTSAAVLGRLTRALAPGGYLFLGHSDTMRGTSDGIQVRRTHNTFYYQRDIAPPSPPSRRDVYQAPAVAGPATAHWDLALDLLRGERFAEALRLVESFPLRPSGQPDPPDSMVLYAQLLIHAGLLGRAEEICRRLLELDGSNAQALYLMGSCRELTGDAMGAVDHNQAAAAFDPGFAMPRLRLGLLARQRGDNETARRELRRALALMAREEPRRILLFGGGFDRVALTAMSRAELLASGGVP